MLLNCDEGAYSLGKSTNEQICAVLKTGMRTIDRIKRKCVEGGVEYALEQVASSRNIEFHVLNTQCLKRHIATTEEIKQEIDAWQEHRNGKNCKINWQFSTADARIKLK